MSELTKFLKHHHDECRSAPFWQVGEGADELCTCGIMDAREYYCKMLKELKETKKGKAKLADFIDTMANDNY